MSLMAFLSIFISLVISTVLVRIVLNFCKKHEIYDSTNERKIHKGNIPRLGAVGFVPAFSAGAIFYFLTCGNNLGGKIIPLVVAGLLIFAFGIVDDFKELRGIAKLSVQIVAALIVIFSGFRFTNILGLDLGIFGYIITFCWIIGVVNAFNLIDGMDALCGGLCFIISIALGLMTLKENPDMAGILLVLAASILGFLFYNKPKAKIFMGDGGSQFLGFMMAVVPLFETETRYEGLNFLMLAVLCSIPLMDTVAAMWRRTREHRSFFSADRSHLHHKLLNLGYSVKQSLVLLYVFQSFLCGICYVGILINGRAGAAVIFCGLVAVCIFFTIIHYTNRAVLLKHIREKEENTGKSGDAE